MNTHPFEKSGLGQAPFRCVGVTENVFMLPDGGSKAGGCCDYCFTGIRYEFHIESADEKNFKVGCDCVRKAGWITGFTEVRAKHARQKRQAGAAVRREAREAEWAAQRAQITADRRAAFDAAYPDLSAQLLAYEGTNEFLSSMKGGLIAWGGLTEKQAAAAQNALTRLAEHEQAKVTSKWFGGIGDKVTLTLTVNRVINMSYGSYPTIVSFLYLCTDENGNAVNYKGNSAVFDNVDTVTVKATIKEHTEYNGVMQTVIQRPKAVA
jgi:hypothetical protein